MLSNHPQIRVDFKDTKGLKLAEVFGANFTVNSAHIDKSFRKEAFKNDKHILVFEGGESMRLDDKVIQEGIDGTGRLLKHLEMIDGDYPSTKTKKIEESSWVRARVSGIFNSSVSLGEEVKKGQMLAKISDPYGQVKVPVKASASGYIIGVNNLPVVNAGDALVHIGKSQSEG